MRASDLVPPVSPAAGDGDDPGAGRLDRDGRLARLAALAGLAGVTAYVFAADPDGSGVYPPCPSRTFLGVDCPACGGLRGTSALLHGRVGEALDHNVLLPLFLGGAALVLVLWLLPLVGLTERRLHLPRWVSFGLIALLAAFAVVRNLPVDAFDYLASEA